MLSDVYNNRLTDLKKPMHNRQEEYYGEWIDKELGSRQRSPLQWSWYKPWTWSWGGRYFKRSSYSRDRPVAEDMHDEEYGYEKP